MKENRLIDNRATDHAARALEHDSEMFLKTRESLEQRGRILSELVERGEAGGEEAADCAREILKRLDEIRESLNVICKIRYDRINSKRTPVERLGIECEQPKVWGKY
jgi:hypothetical protein